MNPLETESRKTISQYSSRPISVDWTNVENNTTIFSLIIGLVQQAETQPVGAVEKKKMVLDQIKAAAAAENASPSISRIVESLGGDKLSSLIDSIALGYQGKIQIEVATK